MIWPKLVRKVQFTSPINSYLPSCRLCLRYRHPRSLAGVFQRTRCTPCLATDRSQARQASINLSDASSSGIYGLSLVDCVFYPNHENQQSFPWTGPDPLSPSTKAEDLFVCFSAFLLSEEVYWVEFCLSRFDSLSDELIGEHIFFLPRIKTAMGNLSRVRKQILDIISQVCSVAQTARFQLSMWPRLEPLPYAQHFMMSPQSTLPTLSCLDPGFFP
jgi:hypothetical protein